MVGATYRDVAVSAAVSDAVVGAAVGAAVGTAVVGADVGDATPLSFTHHQEITVGMIVAYEIEFTPYAVLLARFREPPYHLGVAILFFDTSTTR